jgi:hypothetical protein
MFRRRTQIAHSRGPIAFVAFVAFVATASLLAAAAVTSSSGTVVVPPPHPPRGDAVVFGGGRGGFVVVVVICVLAPHVVKETPGVVVIRMGEDDRPSPTAYGYFVLLAVCSAICSAKFGFFLPGRTLNG